MPKRPTARPVKQYLSAVQYRESEIRKITHYPPPANYVTIVQLAIMFRSRFTEEETQINAGFAIPLLTAIRNKTE